MAERSDPADVAAMDARIDAIGGWRGETLAHMRALIREALPEVVEAMKWKKPTNPAGVAVWELPGTAKKTGGILCMGDAFKGKVKITFARGAKLPDPEGLLNSGNGNTMKAIDIAQGKVVDAAAFRALMKAAAADQAAQREKA